MICLYVKISENFISRVTGEIIIIIIIIIIEKFLNRSFFVGR